QHPALPPPRQSATDPGGLVGLDTLRDSLRTLTDRGGLADRLADGRIDPLPQASAEPPPADFDPSQRQAFHACLVPGVRLVCGPPGAERTRVLVEAIDRLVERGRRVLLLSASDPAVDETLLE